VLGDLSRTPVSSQQCCCCCPPEQKRNYSIHAYQKHPTQFNSILTTATMIRIMKTLGPENCSDVSCLPCAPPPSGRAPAAGGRGGPLVSRPGEWRWWWGAAGGWRGQPGVRAGRPSTADTQWQCGVNDFTLSMKIIVASKNTPMPNMILSRPTDLRCQPNVSHLVSGGIQIRSAFVPLDSDPHQPP